MKILITNDDGIEAKGIQTLVKVLGNDHDIFVSAPVSQRSGYSHSVTYFYNDHKVFKRKMTGAKAAFAVDGTPADCIYYGIYAFMHEKPDLVISGINHGPNLSTDALYSGTIGAAAEGLVAGIPAMALSLCTHDDYDFTTAAEIAAEMIPYYSHDPDSANFLLSINVPSLPKQKIKGFRATYLEGMRDYEKAVIMEEQADGSIILKCPNQPVGTKNKIGLEGDVSAVEAGFVSLTPVTLDWTDYRKMKDLRHWPIMTD